MTIDDLDSRDPCEENHPSFTKTRDGDVPPGVALLTEQVDSGFAYLFESLDQARGVLGAKVHPAPLGNIEKIKEDGTVKDRLIQDQSANFVNSAVVLPERQVLPRGVDHGRDLAVLGDDLRDGEVLRTLVLDFKDAFMSLAIHPLERRFNCAHTTGTVKRSRPPLFEEEVAEGRFVVWKVLGFGGRPNPLIFSRAASLACRMAQGLVAKNLDDDAEARIQLYVDDPIITVRGSEEKCQETLDHIIMLWLAIGIPLSWKKGHLYEGNQVHRWIGIMFHLTGDGAVMRLPRDFVDELLQLLAPACKSDGVLTIGELEVLVGKAARVAHVVPTAKPFVGGLWGALAAAKKAAAHRGNCSSTRVPTRRFCYSASWVAALLAEDGSCPLVLERLITPQAPRPAAAADMHIEFDASVYGGGAVLKNNEDFVLEYICVVWSEDDAPHLGVWPGDSKHQTFFEFLTLLLALMVWGDNFVDVSVPILGDNTGALSAALSLKGRGTLMAVARELSWRKARHRWTFEVGHLPSEHNVVSDALSRAADPAGVPWPAWALGSATARKCPKISDVWKALPR